MLTCLKTLLAVARVSFRVEHVVSLISAVLLSKRTWGIAPARAWCELGTSHELLNCFPGLPAMAFLLRKAHGKLQMSFRI